MALPVVYRRKVGRDLAGAYGWYEEQRAGLGRSSLLPLILRSTRSKSIQRCSRACMAKCAAQSYLGFPMRCSTASRLDELWCLPYSIWAVTPSCGPNLGGTSANQGLEGSKAAEPLGTRRASRAGAGSSVALELVLSRRIISVMTNAAKQLIDSFEALSEDEKHEVLAQLLRRLMSTPYSSPSDEDLVQAADLVFQEYDRRENQG